MGAAAFAAVRVNDPEFGGALADLAQEPDVTVATIAEAEKLAGIRLTEPQRRELLATLQNQVAAAASVRKEPRELDLEPALVFDPRLPGVVYPPQQNGVTLSPLSAGPMPRDPTDIAYASVREQAQWIRAGHLTSRRLTEIYLERIERLAPQLFCYITVTRELALRQAQESDRELAAGRDRGALHGIPYGVKDVFDTAGIASTWGAEPYRDRVPAADAVVVSKLREAGAVLLGKLATGALANGATWFGGTCRNPWNLEESAGGSSTGAGSATAAGLCAFSIGTDSLGSIINPADRCGTVGLRATFGRVPHTGSMPLTPSLSRIGPLTRTVEDAALVLAAINGHDPASAASLDVGFACDFTTDVRTLRVGYAPTWFEGPARGFAGAPASDAHRTALEALRELGVQLVEIELPDRPYLALVNNLYVEAAAVFQELTLSGRDSLLPDGGAFGWPQGWRRAHLLSAVDYLQAERLRRQVMRDWHELFSRVDLVFGPTYADFNVVAATNYTGHPGLGLRCGFTTAPNRDAPRASGGSPRTVTQNVTMHGRLFEEGRLLALGRALEQRLDVWRRRPPLG